jgi:uncharacterized protein YdhG (YjbR/CyaY superfamily)
VAKPRSAAAEVKNYIAAQPPKTRKALKQLRVALRAAAPKAVDGFSYRIPCLRVDDRPLVWYAGWKNHVSLYPMGDAIRKKFAGALDGYETSKGTIRFPLDELPSASLVKRLVNARIAEMKN